MADRRQWANALQGAGAWFSGNGPAYMAAQARQAEAAALHGYRQQQMAHAERQARVEAARRDAMQASAFIRVGRTDEAIKLFEDRDAILTASQQDNSHTQKALRLMKSDPVAALAYLDPEGAEAPKPDEYLGTLDGQALMRGDRGVYAQDIQGIRSKPEDAYDPELEIKFSGEEQKLTKTFREINDSFGRIQAAYIEPSAAGDLAMVFAFMKMLDPGSTVREGEQATARNASGVPTRVRTAYNNALTGESLGDTQRDDFYKRAGLLYQNAMKDYDKRITGFRKRLGNYEVRPDAIIQDRALYRDWESQIGKEPPGNGPLSPDEMAELEALRKKYGPQS